MPKYKVFLTGSVEYTAIVDAEDVDDAKATAEALPLKSLTRATEGSWPNVEAWDAVRQDKDGAP